MATQQGWTNQSIGSGLALVPILTRSDNGRVVAVPAHPLLAHDAMGRPRLSLTLVLAQRPSVDVPSVAPLITQATIAFTVTLALPQSPASAAGDTRGNLEPLFVRSADFALRYDDVELQSTQAFGPGATAAFSVMLNRDAALEAVSAIRGCATRLTLDCDVAYLVDDTTRRLRLRGKYDDIYTYLVEGGRRPLDRSTLERCVGTMLFDGTLAVESEPDQVSTSAVTSALLKVAGPVLKPVSAPDGERFSPRLPAPGQVLDVVLREQGGGHLATLNLTTPLGELFRGCLEGHDSGTIVHLIAPDNTGTLVALPERLVHRPAREMRAIRAPGTGPIARVGTSAIALTASARPSAITAISAHALMVDTTVRPTFVGSSKIHYWAVDDLAFPTAAAGQPAERALPIVDDPTAPLWTDRVDAAARWYAPELAADPPPPNVDPQQSTFLLSFRSAGHMMSGQPGIEGLIRFRLQSKMRVETVAAWQAAGRPPAKPVQLIGLSIALSVPFRDNSGDVRTQNFPAKLTNEGDTVVAEVLLIDDWLRLAYGALSTPGFQSKPAALSVAYMFEAYVPLSEDKLSLLFDRKYALTQVVQKQTPEPEQSAYLDVGRLAYRMPVGAIQFAREKPEITRPQPHATLSSRPEGPAFAIRPELQASNIAEFIRRREYGIQSLGRDTAQTVEYPCSALGAFYIQEDAAGGPTAIGCRDSFKLGQTEYRQYRRIETLDDPDFSVWRSLQQPGQFLMVPARWNIGRFAAEDPERAYRPSILVYSIIDAETPANNRCVVLASLIPDIPPVKWAELMRSLSSLAQKPMVTLVNETESELEYVWPLPPSSGVEVRVAKLFDSFQVTIATGIDSMPQLQTMLRASGLMGSVHYRLPDGTTFESTLALDLNDIVGPLPGGPIEVDVQAQNVRLTNRIERAVDLSDLVVETSNGRIETIRVDKRLPPGIPLDVAVSAEVARATPVATYSPGDAATLTEIRSFVEDVHTNVAFVNLINYANHGLQGLSLQARLRGVEGSQALVLEESKPVVALDFVLPLTTYLDNPVLEFAITKTPSDDATTTWLEWQLVERGNVVSLTWELVQ